MARDFSVTVNASAGGTTYSPCYVPDYHANGFYVSMVVGPTAGAPEYTVQHTLSDPFTQNLNIPTNGTWFNHAYMVSGATAQGNYAFPVKGIRLAVHANTSAFATFTILQGEGFGG